ncbi:MAG: hypothetical protein GX666_06075 [Tissierellia bacterium]|nr:hypothetical protein [Tissierellia bacterium]
MSLFLAPIHSIMYSKIKNQDKINSELISEFGDEKLLLKVTNEVGSLPDGELADVIDTQNIHGWLQSQIDVVEKAFSLIVENLMDNGVSKETLIKWFEDSGKKFDTADSGEELFGMFSGFYLDGMPCDRAIQPLELEDTHAKWVQNIDVHGKYWNDGGELYNELRCAMIRGMAENSGFEFKYNEGTYEVTK